jgi:hypothetical protein
MKSKKLKKGDIFVVRLFKEEEMFSKIREFCTAEGITSASLTAIGALKKATLGFFNFERMKYMKFEVEEAEIASCTGNISIREGEIVIHAHAVLSDMKGHCHGGHLFEAYIGATAEIFFETFSFPLERVKDDETSLFLLHLG